MTALEVKIPFYIINSDKDLLDAGCLWQVHHYLGENEAAKEKLHLEYLLYNNNTDEYYNNMIIALNGLDEKTQIELLVNVKLLFVNAMQNYPVLNLQLKQIQYFYRKYSS